MTNASLARRIGAMVYDGLLVLALLIIGTLPFIALRDGSPVQSGEFPYRVMLLLIIYAFFVGFWTRYGRTLGMQSWGLRIETPTLLTQESPANATTGTPIHSVSRVVVLPLLGNVSSAMSIRLKSLR